MKLSENSFNSLPLKSKARLLYTEGTFIVAIRYYGYKVNLYMLHSFFVEVFYNHKLDMVEKVEVLEKDTNRMKFYADQIKLPQL